MSNAVIDAREGSLDAPTRHPLDWLNESFYDEALLNKELERAFDICHGCRRCVNLCQSFPTLFDLVDATADGEVHGIPKADYSKIVDQCYLCDLCYQTKCPYVPPHPWNLDFPHLMLRAKAVKYRQGKTAFASKLLSSTTAVGKLASIPVVVELVNASNRNGLFRKLLDKTLGVHPEAVVPKYYSKTARRRLGKNVLASAAATRMAGPTRGKVALFTTCYGNVNMPQVVEDMVIVFRHNGIEVKLIEREQCCGMPKLELGDLEAVARYKAANLPVLAKAVAEGFDIVAPIPSCVLMFKQELPLMFPNDAEVMAVKRAIFDPFEYLMHRHQASLLNTEFPNALGKIAYHVPCHQRVQNIGPKTRDVLALVPGTEFHMIERCSGHDGTYGVKTATYPLARKIAKPVSDRVAKANADHFVSDCPMAAAHIADGVSPKPEAGNPMSLLRRAYGI
jgi:glycerol-3-phosphate dehydrogenase subunit C